MNWLDLGILVVLAILIIIGIRQGLMNSVLSNFSLGTNCLISFFLATPLKFIFNKIFRIGPAISKSIYNSIANIEGFNVNLVGLSTDTLHDTVKMAIDNGDFNFMSKTMFKIFLNKKNLYEVINTSGHTSRTMADIVSQTYSSFYMTIIAFVTALIFVFISVKLFQLLANKLRENGSVKTVDSVLGALYGVFRCFVLLVIICTVVKFLSPIGFMQPVVNYIDGSFLGQFIYSVINDFVNNYLSFSDIVASIFK